MNQESKNFASVLLSNVDPKHITLDITANEKRAALYRATRDKANPTEPVPLRVEYNQLRQQLFDLQQNAKHMEIYLNTRVDEVKGFEDRINNLLKKKKASGDNPLAERAYEHQIQMLETELIDAKTEMNRARKQNTNAVSALKGFTGHERIKELKKELGA